MVFGIGTCSMMFSLAEDMKNNLKAINSRKKKLEKVHRLSQFVQFHSKLIKLNLTKYTNTIPSLKKHIYNSF